MVGGVNSLMELGGVPRDEVREILKRFFGTLSIHFGWLTKLIGRELYCIAYDWDYVILEIQDRGTLLLSNTGNTLEGVSVDGYNVFYWWTITITINEGVRVIDTVQVSKNGQEPPDQMSAQWLYSNIKNVVSIKF